MRKKHVQKASEDLIHEGITPVEAPQATYRGQFNGNRIAFDVPEGVTGDLTVFVNGEQWGQAELQSPVTVVVGEQLPKYHRITFTQNTN